MKILVKCYLKVNLDQKTPLNVIQCQYYPNGQKYLQHNIVKVDQDHIHFHKDLPNKITVILF